VEYEGCKDFKCGACDRILGAIAGPRNATLQELLVRLNCTEHMSPSRVLTTLAGAAVRTLARLTLKTGVRQGLVWSGWQMAAHVKGSAMIGGFVREVARSVPRLVGSTSNWGTTALVRAWAAGACGEELSSCVLSAVCVANVHRSRPSTLSHQMTCTP
jgi:hypothetical protein